jgi:MFS transporter, DHA3 family, macrolide efflux protein
MRNIDFPFPRPHGLKGLFVIWLGQFVSGVASSITTVALPIWIFNVTGSGMAVGLLEFFFFGSYLLVVLFAGVLIDRYNRKMMMLLYDFMSLAALTVLLVLQSSGNLQVWQLYVAAVVQGVGYAFQSPSYSAAISIMVPQKQYIRANGLMSLLNDGPEIFGPLLAGGLYIVSGLQGIMALNLLALIFSIGTLLFVEIPDTPHTREGQLSQSNLHKQVLYGIQYIFRRPGLLGLQLVFSMGNLFFGIALSIAALYPMILLRTGGETQAVGVVQSAGALAAVLSGIVLTTWGRIRRPVNTILLGWLLSSIFGLIFLGVGQTLIIWVIAMIINSAFEPVVNVSMDTFLQTKVPPDLQGRVFSASDFIAQVMIPFTPLLAGLFGDQIFEPAMQPGGSLAHTFGWLVGVGPGAGFGLLIFLCGVGGILVGLSGYLVKEIRSLDAHTPDFQLPDPEFLLQQPQPVYIASGTVHEPEIESGSPASDSETISERGETQTPQSEQ